jgi:DNA-binding IclR family transcriptional regulator
MLRTLEKHGLVARHGKASTYTLGHHALYLGLAAEGQVELARAASRALHELGHAFGESVQLRIRDGFESVCIARWEHPQHARLGPRRFGIRRPLHAGAAGKVLLAHAGPALREAVLDNDLVSFTRATLVTRSSIGQALAKVQAAGYAISFGEVVANALAVAAPVRDSQHAVTAVLSVAGPEARLTPKLGALIEQVMIAANRLSEDIGFR